MDIQPVVLGTAGHIDHGKSTLVRALTGIDPDRLKEERERGLTIDLGFANLPLPDGRRVGLIDVPGHERFIRNMVAGASGMDLVVLVVAADDGVMPQTREHLAIMQMLGLKQGLVALTKIDAVEADLVELVREDLSEQLEGTFLEDAPIFPLSALTGDGLEPFKGELLRRAMQIKPKSADGPFRLPVQRVFSKAGFGTVCTGVPVSGTAEVGDALEVLPGERKVKVRSIQAYGQSAERARAGHSSALNLTDLETDQVERGHVVATPGIFRAANMVAARLDVLVSYGRKLKDRMPIRLHTGTADPRGEVVLLEDAELAPGTSGLVQLRLEEPVVTAPGDRFVLRLLSPEITIGGGVVLEESRHRLKRGKGFVLEELGQQEQSLEDPKKLLATVLERRHLEPVTVEELAAEVKRSPAEVQRFLQSLSDRGLAVSAGKGARYLGANAVETGLALLKSTSDAWFAAHDNRLQVSALELQQESGLGKASYEALLSIAVERGDFESLPGGQVRPKGLIVEADPQADQVHGLLDGGAFKPPSAAELIPHVGSEDKAEALLVKLCDQNRAVRVAPGMYFARGRFDAAIEAVTRNCEANGQLVIPDLREELATSRKYLIPLLEHLDATGVTMRQGAHRVLRKR